MIISAICVNPGDVPETPISVGGRVVFAPRPEALAGVFTDAREIRHQPLLEECTLPRGRFGRPAKEEVRRAKAVIDALLTHGEDCVIAAPPQFLELLLDQMERKALVILRRERGTPRPFERIRISERKDHCGFCNHNCLLRNPGCGIGMDKARARGMEG